MKIKSNLDPVNYITTADGERLAPVSSHELNIKISSISRNISLVPSLYDLAMAQVVKHIPEISELESKTLSKEALEEIEKKKSDILNTQPELFFEYLVKNPEFRHKLNTKFFEATILDFTSVEYPINKSWLNGLLRACKSSSQSIPKILSNNNEAPSPNNEPLLRVLKKIILPAPIYTEKRTFNVDENLKVISNAYELMEFFLQLMEIEHSIKSNHSPFYTSKIELSEIPSPRIFLNIQRKLFPLLFQVLDRQTTEENKKDISTFLMHLLTKDQLDLLETKEADFNTLQKEHLKKTNDDIDRFIECFINPNSQKSFKSISFQNKTDEYKIALSFIFQNMNETQKQRYLSFISLLLCTPTEVYVSLSLLHSDPLRLFDLLSNFPEIPGASSSVLEEDELHIKTFSEEEKQKFLEQKFIVRAKHQLLLNILTLERNLIYYYQSTKSVKNQQFAHKLLLVLEENFNLYLQKMIETKNIRTLSISLSMPRFAEKIFKTISPELFSDIVKCHQQDLTNNLEKIINLFSANSTFDLEKKTILSELIACNITIINKYQDQMEGHLKIKNEFYHNFFYGLQSFSIKSSTQDALSSYDKTFLEAYLQVLSLFNESDRLNGVFAYFKELFTCKDQKRIVENLNTSMNLSYESERLVLTIRLLPLINCKEIYDSVIKSNIKEHIGRELLRRLLTVGVTCDSVFYKMPYQSKK